MLIASDTFAATPSTSSAQSRVSFSNTLTAILSSRIGQFTNFLRNFSCVRNTADEVETVHQSNLRVQSEKFRAHITADTLVTISYHCMTKDSSNAFLNTLSTLADMANPLTTLGETLTSKSNGGQDVRRDVMASLSALTSLGRCADSTKDTKILADIAMDIQRLASNFDKKYAWLSNPTTFIANEGASQQEKIAFVVDFAQQMLDLKIKLGHFLAKESVPEDSGYSSPSESVSLTINNSLTSIREHQDKST